MITSSNKPHDPIVYLGGYRDGRLKRAKIFIFSLESMEVIGVVSHPDLMGKVSGLDLVTIKKEQDSGE